MVSPILLSLNTASYPSICRIHETRSRRPSSVAWPVLLSAPFILTDVES